MIKRGIGLGLLLTIVGFGVSCQRSSLVPIGSNGERGGSLFKVTLEGFRFSKGLPDRKSNFRFIVGLRYFDKDGNFNTVHTTLPGLDAHWECAKSNREKTNYVRGPVKDGYVNFDMKAVGEWDSLIFVVRGIKLDSIQFKVFHANREDVLEKLTGVFKGSLATTAKAITGIISPALASPVKGLGEDLRLAFMNTIAKDDELLFRKSHSFNEGGSLSRKYKIFSNETEQKYEITYKVTSQNVFD